MIEIKKSGVYWEVIKDGHLFCLCRTKELAEEVKEDLERLERGLDRKRH